MCYGLDARKKRKKGEKKDQKSALSATLDAKRRIKRKAQNMQPTGPKEIGVNAMLLSKDAISRLKARLADVEGYLNGVVTFSDLDEWRLERDQTYSAEYWAWLSEIDGDTLVVAVNRIDQEAVLTFRHRTPCDHYGQDEKGCRSEDCYNYRGRDV